MGSRHRGAKLRPLAALALVTLLGAGCSNTPARSGSDDTTAGTRAQTVRFAECMRANGVTEFPDPDASGQLTIDGVLNGSSLDPSDPAWRSAIGVCKDLQPPGFTGHQRSAQQQEAALRFARCMREGGVEDFPDPTPDAPLIDTERIPSLAGKNPRSDPGLTAAMQACRDLAGAAGVTGGR